MCCCYLCEQRQSNKYTEVSLVVARCVVDTFVGKDRAISAEVSLVMARCVAVISVSRDRAISAEVSLVVARCVVVVTFVSRDLSLIHI